MNLTFIIALALALKSNPNTLWRGIDMLDDRRQAGVDYDQYRLDILCLAAEINVEMELERWEEEQLDDM